MVARMASTDDTGPGIRRGEGGREWLGGPLWSPGGGDTAVQLDGRPCPGPTPGEDKPRPYHGRSCQADS